MRHRSWRLAVWLILVPLAAVAATAAQSPGAGDTVSLTLPRPDRGGVIVANTRGSIRVEAWDRAEVKIEAHKSADGPDAAAARELLAEFRVVTRDTPEGLRIEVQHPPSGDAFWERLAAAELGVEVSLDLTVPPDLALTVQAVNGDLEVGGVGGRLLLATINGNILVEGARGAVDAAATNGDIRAQVGAVEDDVSLRTVNGSITLALPPGAAGQVEARSSNGRVQTDFPVAGRRQRRSLLGSLNGGGPRLRLRTFNGDIRIVKH